MNIYALFANLLYFTHTNTMLNRIVLFMVLLLAFLTSAGAEILINRIYIDRREVFDTTKGERFFLAPLLNALHINTREYIIEDELLFSEGQWLKSDEPLAETERNLRALNLFTDVKIELDSLDYDKYNAYIVTHERWTTWPNILFGVGGGVSNYGAGIEENNFLGFGTGIMAEGLFRQESNIGWQFFGELLQKRIFRSDFTLLSTLRSNKIRTEQYLELYKPFRTLKTEWSYGAIGQNWFGSDILYEGKDTFSLLPFHERKVSAFLSKAWLRKDRIFITGLLEYHDVNRPKPEYKQAFDNSGKFLVSFSSVSQRFLKTVKLNSHLTEDMNIGGYGAATLGKIFPIGSKGEGYYYVGGQGEQSYWDGSSYLWGQITGGGAFADGESHFTYQEFHGLAFHRFSENFLIAARLRQQTVWRWNAMRQLILDSDAGLRGYDANRYSGDNRIIGNLEMRIFPDWELLLFKFSAAAFYDVGSVWNQKIQLNKAQFHNAAGLGLRVHFLKSSSPNAIFRIDFAYNFTERKFGGIIFTTSQMFSVFGNHDFKLPEIFGNIFEYE